MKLVRVVAEKRGPLGFPDREIRSPTLSPTLCPQGTSLAGSAPYCAAGLLSSVVMKFIQQIQQRGSLIRVTPQETTLQCGCRVVIDLPSGATRRRRGALRSRIPSAPRSAGERVPGAFLILPVASRPPSLSAAETQRLVQHRPATQRTGQCKAIKG
ncbi:hypothetical protein THAOC_08145, partial [Thalassiosira oceanica]